MIETAETTIQIFSLAGVILYVMVLCSLWGK